MVVELSFFCEGRVVGSQFSAFNTFDCSIVPRSTTVLNGMVRVCATGYLHTYQIRTNCTFREHSETGTQVLYSFDKESTSGTIQHSMTNTTSKTYYGNHGKGVRRKGSRFFVGDWWLEKSIFLSAMAEFEERESRIARRITYWYLSLCLVP